MALFNETLKLYYKRDRDQVDVSFLVSPNYVQTFYFSRDEFDKIIEKCDKPGGFERPGLFIFLKKDFLRWSADGNGMTHQIRVERAKWEALIEQYQRGVKSTGASMDPLITCVVK